MKKRCFNGKKQEYLKFPLKNRLKKDTENVHTIENSEEQRYANLENAIKTLKMQVISDEQKIEYLETSCKYLARECNKAKWMFIDLCLEKKEQPEDIVSCIICGFSQK